MTILCNVMYSCLWHGIAFALLSIGMFCLVVTLFSPGCARRGNDSQPNANQERVFAAEHKREAREWFQKGFKAASLAEKEFCYIEALKLWPSYPEAHNNLGDTYEREGRLEEALREYEMAVVLVPGFAVAHFSIGDVCLKMGRFYRAVQAYEKGLRLEPENKLSQRRLRITKGLVQTIHFRFNSSELTEQAMEQVCQMVHVLQEPEVKDMVFEIQGHADSTGSADYNMQLSLRRARALKDFLINTYRIPASRLIAKGYGDDRPIASNETGEGRAMNRRVQLVKFERKIDIPVWMKEP